jgi:hypothetical protein
VFSSLGEPSKTVTYRYLQEKFSINRLGGPNHIEDFSDVLDHKNNTFKDEVHSRSIAVKLEYISESTTINKLRLMITTYVTWG